MDVLAAIDLLDITRCKPPFCIRASTTLFRTCYLLCLTMLKMRCHKGIHLKFSIYPHQPQFGGWYGAGKTLRLVTPYQNSKEDLFCKGTGQIYERVFGSTRDSNPVTTTMGWLEEIVLGSRDWRVNNRSVCRLDLVCCDRVASWLVRVNKSRGGNGVHTYGSRADKSIFTIKILLKNINLNNKVWIGWLEGGGGWSSSEHRRRRIGEKYNFSC